jgi:MFS family permease
MRSVRADNRILAVSRRTKEFRMDEVLVEPKGSGEPEGARTPRKAALAAWIGSVLEYYDFFIYGTAAALVFPSIFFPMGNDTVATIASLATFGVGYVARPVGAFFMGHIGDKFGRKRVLIATLIMMGVSTFAIGLLPTYSQVGLFAPGLLVALRLLQGLSASGEQAGANSMTLEHAPAGRRGYYSSFTLSGTQAGSIVANAVFLPLAAVLSKEQLLSWGWRIPFFLSVVVVVVGFIIRRTLDETPAFKEEAAHDEVPPLPLKILLRDHWLSVLRVVVAALVSVVSTIFGVYALSYATKNVGISSTAMLWVGICANVVALFAIPLWATLSDRIGRKPVFIGGALGSAVLIFVYLGAISSKNILFIFIAGIVLSGVVYSAANGVWPSFYGEMFTTQVRLSGMAIGTQIGFAIGGFSPSIAAAIEGKGSTGWLPVAILVAVACVLAAASAATARDNYNVPLKDLGRKGEVVSSR